MEGFVRWRHICRVGSVLREFSESNLWCWSIWIALGLKWKSSARLSSVQRVEGWRRGDFFFWRTVAFKRNCTLLNVVKQEVKVGMMVGVDECQNECGRARNEVVG